MKTLKQTRNEFSRFLRDKRKEAGLSQVEVAKKLGYSSSQFVSNWERGVAAPPLRTLRRIASLYGLSDRNIFDRIRDMAFVELEENLKFQFFGKKLKH